MMFSQNDHLYMKHAIELAKKGRYTTSPNPNVGCVLVKNGEIVGEGFHQTAGKEHAEVNALLMAGALAKGATAYVTLEPCSHFGRTPPCAAGLIKAGVVKVIAAMEDPNPKVSGRGLNLLRNAGIDVFSGLLESEAKSLNVGFIKRMQTNLPWVTCKLATSLDGKTALKNGESKWITGTEARADVQNYRAQSCAIITGADTVLIDNAKMNVRYEEMNVSEINETELRQPIRIVIDSQNRLTPDLAFFQIASPIIILTTKLEKQHHWPHFVTHIEIPEVSGKVDLIAALKLLADKEINQIWLEAGHTLAGKFAELDLIDSYVFYIAPKLMGDSAKSAIKLPEFTQMSQALALEITDVTLLGRDIRVLAKKSKNITEVDTSNEGV